MNRIFTTVFILFMFIIFIMTIRGAPGNPTIEELQKNPSHNPPFESSLERGRFAQTISIAEDGSFNVDKFVDFLKPDLAWYSGHFYPAFPPGVSVISVPLYLIGKSLGYSQIFTYSISTFFTILTCLVLIMIYKILKINPLHQLIVLTILVFGSSIFSYSVTLSAHTISAFFVSLSFLIYLKIDQIHNNIIYFSVLSAILGVNLFVDYPNLLILLPITFASIGKVVSYQNMENFLRLSIPLWLLKSVFPLLIFLGLFIVYNLHHYQKPIAFTNTYNLQRLVLQGVSFSYDNLNNELFSQKHYSERFSNFANVHKGINTLLFSSDRGLFFYSPIFLLAIIGLITCIVYKQNYVYVILISFLANLILYASFDDPWGGWSFGPRYLIATLPLLSILILKGMSYLIKASILFWIPIYILSIISVAVNLLGALTTNAVPPSIESVALGIPDNFVLNWGYLWSGNVSSYLFNFLFANILKPFEYYSLVSGILFFVLGLLILLAIFRNKKDEYGF